MRICVVLGRLFPWRKADCGMLEEVYCKAVREILSRKMFLQPDVRMKDVARAAGTNRTYLCEALRRKGFSIRTLMDRIRTLHFIKMSCNDNFRDKSVTEISEICGFYNPRKLNREMQKLLGISAAAYLGKSRQSKSPNT